MQNCSIFQTAIQLQQRPPSQAKGAEDKQRPKIMQRTLFRNLSPSEPNISLNMVIYQKQHRLAYGRYCELLSENRLTRFLPPSKKKKTTTAVLPSGHIYHVNIKCIIKTLFSSKCTGINFKGKKEKSLLSQKKGREWDDEGKKTMAHIQVWDTFDFLMRSAKPKFLPFLENPFQWATRMSSADTLRKCCSLICCRNQETKEGTNPVII